MMMLTATARDAIMYGALGFALFGLIVLRRLHLTSRARATFPTAIAGPGRARRSFARRALPLPLVVAPLAVALWAHAHSLVVVHVTDASFAGLDRIHRALVREIDQPIADGAMAETGGEWLVNDSSRTVRVVPVHCQSLRGDDPPVVLPPGTAASFPSVEFLGRFNPPSHLCARGVEMRYGLTWD